jgi:acyl-CoA synthetase (AMP-forming)/AMP-acid ligase II
VRATVLDRFARRFERCGFRRAFFYPCYGLAEATLFVTGKPRADVPDVPSELFLSASALEQHRVESRPAGDPSARAFVSSGAPRLEAGVVIVRPEDRTRAEPGEVGEIWTRGPNIAAGYWDDQDKTRAAFGLFLSDTGEGPFLATGDLGFIDEGELYVTGRSKEVLILAGKNHYPQDLEETVEESHPDLRHGGSAAFSFERDDEEEALAVVAELSAERIGGEAAVPAPRRYHDVASAVRAALLAGHSVVPKEIVLLPPGGLVKTTSGKKARIEMRRRFLDGALERA